MKNHDMFTYIDTVHPQSQGLAATSARFGDWHVFHLPWGWQMAAIFDSQMSPPGLPEPGGALGVSSAGGNGTGLSEDTNNIKATIIQEMIDGSQGVSNLWRIHDQRIIAQHSTANLTYWSLLSAKVKVPFIGRCICETLRWSHTIFSDTSMKASDAPYFVVQSGFQIQARIEKSSELIWPEMVWLFSEMAKPCVIFRAVLEVLSLVRVLCEEDGLEVCASDFAPSCRFFASRTCKEGFYKPSEKLNKR